jgi:chromate transporter
MSTYLQLVVLFGSLSLMSFGGGNAVLPEMHLRSVHQHHWLTDTQFADLFSISQTAPGPSILIVGMVGYAAGLPVGGVWGGILGGVLATAAMVVPAASTPSRSSGSARRTPSGGSRWRRGLPRSPSA